MSQVSRFFVTKLYVSSIYKFYVKVPLMPQTVERLVIKLGCNYLIVGVGVFNYKIFTI